MHSLLHALYEADQLTVEQTLFPETAAGGFHRLDARVAFYARVRSLIDPASHVLDFGAGRGKFAEMESAAKRRITDVSGAVARYAVFDVDPVVMTNPVTQDRHHAPVDAALPFADASFDVITSWMVFEHITNPDFYAAELGRILKPGGWICAMTPNRRGYFSLGARMIPEALHRTVLHRLVPHKKDEDGFPTVYRLNTLGSLERHFPADRFDHFSYYQDPGPGYYGRSLALARMVQAYNWLVPAPLLPHIFVLMRKRG